MKSKLFKVLLSVLAVSIFVSSVEAAAPDGLGPWADEVVTSSQANTKGGTPVSTVNPLRSDPTSALGIAEDDSVDGHFFSLGFGGSITLRFDNGISSGVFLVEATNPNYPLERANVEISENGSDWYAAGQVVQDGSVSVPREVDCAAYVRITDASDPNDFTEDTADAYDVDGVEAQGEPCDPPASPTPTPTPITEEVLATFTKDGPGCGNPNFDAKILVELNGAPQSGVDVEFVYKSDHKNVTTGPDGRAQAGFEFKGDDNVVAKAAGYPNQTLWVNDPDDCSVVDGAVLGATTEEPAGQVLGASTLASVGTVVDQAFALLFTLGAGLTTIGIRRYGRKRN